MRSPGPAWPAWRRHRRAWASPAFWAWVALSVLPPEILGWGLKWDVWAPGAVAAGLLWWPADVLGRLAALRLLLALDGSPFAVPESLRPVRAAWGPALAAEVLLTLRAVGFLLLGLLPCLLLLSLSEPSALMRAPRRAALLILAVAGLLPGACYLLRRCLSPLELLRSPLNASEALDASARRLAWGRPLLRFLGLAWPWMALSWGLEGLGLCLPEPASWLLDLPSVAAALMPLALAADL